MTPKELYDIRTMRYFIPKSNKGWRIRDYDRQKMADLSSRGIKPKRITKGFHILLWGKTYRDYQVASWREDIADGLITKHEILSSLPKWLVPYVERSLRGAFMSEDGAKFRADAIRKWVLK